MELTNEQLEIIRQECRGIDFGKIIIELNAAEHKIDVVTEKRVRIQKKQKSETALTTQANSANNTSIEN